LLQEVNNHDIGVLEGTQRENSFHVGMVVNERQQGHWCGMLRTAAGGSTGFTSCGVPFVFADLKEVLSARADVVCSGGGGPA
jgi:hypothetical protein